MNCLVLYTETALHVGVGQVLGPVDLPIHREGHTGIPIIPGSALKGALRAAAELWAGEEQAKHDEVIEAFGPEAGESLRQGSLVVGEALPLAVPFRSGRNVFVWATCPLLLERFNRRASGGLSVPDVQAEQAAIERGAGEVVIEDLAFTVRDGLAMPDLVSLLPTPVLEARSAGNGEGRNGELHRYSEVLKQRIAVLSEGDFLFLARHRLPVVARVKLTAGKTTGPWRPPGAGDDEEEKGHLWSEEMVPPDTLFYAPLDEVQRPKGGSGVALGLVSKVLQKKGILQLGGGETVGLGWCWAEVKGT